MNTAQLKTEMPLFTKSFWLICFANLTIFLNMQALLPTLPIYIIQLGGDNKSVGYIMGAFTIASTVVRPLSGILIVFLPPEASTYTVVVALPGNMLCRTTARNRMALA